MAVVHPLISILGPTGSGKTALSLALAGRFNAEIISCDSVAVYREFEIGTAKPSKQDRNRIPHHMIDVASPNDEMTAGEYARRARAALNDIKARNKIPIVVGGTGLYLRALIEGLFPGPQRSEELRERLRATADRKGSAHLHRILRRLDARAAEQIHENDIPKVVRAIEATLANRQPITEQFAAGRDPLEGFRILTIGLDPDREALYTRINLRCARMFADGLVDETRALLAKYPQLLSRPNSPLNALGYKQAVACIRGEMSEKDAIAAAAQAHRNYAKRQLTWFGNQHKDVRWFPAFGEEATAPTISVAEAFLR
jgi:tRNA dimethylallyltransferase